LAALSRIPPASGESHSGATEDDLTKAANGRKDQKNWQGTKPTPHNTIRRHLTPFQLLIIARKELDSSLTDTPVLKKAHSATTPALR
jgi:hypothetical protein